MNNRERMLALIQGRELDRVPFVQYDNISGKNEDIWDVIGLENMGLLRWCGVHRFEHPNSRLETEEIKREGVSAWQTTLTTPVGTLTQEQTLVPAMGGVTSRTSHFVKNVADYPILMAYLRDIEVVEELSTTQKAIADFGDQGLPHVHLGRTPYQQIWVEWVSMMDFSTHLVDAPEVVEECLGLLGDVLRQVFEVAYHAADKIAIPYVVIGDNITAPLIGAARFRTYCVPYYREVAGMMAEKDVPLFVHMDGDLKPLWDAIGESGVKGLDSFSPPPDNDTSVAEAVTMWPEMRLLLNFPSSVHIAGPETVYQRACTILEEGGHTGRLQVQVSENTPPDAWRTSYSQIVRAIDDFGRP